MILSNATIAFLISFLFTFLALPYWIKRSKEHNLVISDAQKLPLRKIPYLAGIVVIFGSVIGVFSYIALQTLMQQTDITTMTLLAAVSTILVAFIIGLVDDLLGEKIGLRQYQKPILTFFAAIPLIVISAGHHVMNVPFLGNVSLGKFYPLLIVPIAIIGASNGFNMLAGLNGLEAGMGIIIIGTLGYISWIKHSTAAMILSLCALAALLVFFWFNKFPAKILPGDSLTYSIGATIAAIAIIGNIEKAAVILFIPYFFEFFLKLLGKFKKESLAEPLKDGSLKNKYDKWYSLNHVCISLLRKIKSKAKEKEAVLILLGIELIIAITVLYPYLKTLTL